MNYSIKAHGQCIKAPFVWYLTVFGQGINRIDLQHIFGIQPTSWEPSVLADYGLNWWLSSLRAVSGESANISDNVIINIQVIGAFDSVPRIAHDLCKDFLSRIEERSNTTLWSWEPSAEMFNMI